MEKIIIGEIYRGSGRPTGRHWPATKAEWRRMYEDGENITNLAVWNTIEEFDADMAEGEHDQCHSPDRPGHACALCAQAGWED